jgi:amidase
VDALCEETGATPSSNILEPYTLGLYEMGRTFTAAQYQWAQNAFHAFGRAAALWHRDYDIALTPTLGTPPLELGRIDPNSSDVRAAIPTLVEFSPFTVIQNATGQPAISLPLHWNADGLPIGVQFIGRFGDESTLLRLSNQIEAAEPWSHRRPPVWD